MVFVEEMGKAPHPGCGACFIYHMSLQMPNPGKKIANSDAAPSIRGMLLESGM